MRPGDRHIVQSRESHQPTLHRGWLGVTGRTLSDGVRAFSGSAHWLSGAGNLFVGDQGSGCIYEYTPDGEQSTFASRLGYDVWDLAFQGESLSVPEPSALGLLAFGLFGITLLRRRQR